MIHKQLSNAARRFKQISSEQVLNALGRWDFLPVERLATHWETLASFISLWCLSPHFGLFLARAALCWAAKRSLGLREVNSLKK
jgi:hypothetical protein